MDDHFDGGEEGAGVVLALGDAGGSAVGEGFDAVACVFGKCSESCGVAGETEGGCVDAGEAVLAAEVVPVDADAVAV